MEKKINLIVKKDDENLRVDIFVSKKRKDISRNRVKNLILRKKLKLNKKIIIDPSKKIIKGDSLILTIPEPRKISLKPFKYKLDIVYEDKDLIVLNKPAGIIMHPGAGNFDNTIVNALIHHNKDSLSNIGDEPKNVPESENKTKKVLINNAKPAAFGAADKNAVTVIGEPSYTSGVQ